MKTKLGHAHRRYLVGSLFASAVALACASGCGDDGGGGGGGSGNLGGGGNVGGSGGSGGSGGATGGSAGSSGGAAGAGGQAGGGGTGGTTVGPGTALKVTECKTLSASSGGLCSVQSGQKGLRLVGTVLAPQEVLRGGEVLLDEHGVITCVGCDCGGAPGAATAHTVTCENGVISPGLINSHDHITYANNAPADSGTLRYDHRHEWRTGKNGKPEIKYSSGASKNVVLAAELRFVMSGATSTVSAGGTPYLLRNLDTGSKEGLLAQTVNSDTFPLDDANGKMLDSGCNYGTSPTTAQDIASLDAYQPHISEGVSQAARNEMTCTTAGALDVVEPQTAIVHAVAVTPTEVKAIYDERAWVIWSPRSNIGLYGNTAPVTLLDNMGVGIALGTDWLLSGSMNLSRELRCADDLNQKYYGKHFSDFDLWRMVTTNGALAAGVELGVGMLKPGFVGDIAIFDGSTNKDHRAVIAAEPKDVALVLRGGAPLYGDDALVGSAAIGGSACETLDVCGAGKRACVAKDSAGTATLAAVKTAGEAFAPLFSCGAPAQEPSCVPSRPNEYTGQSSGSDKDGDGVPDQSDLCPDVFDPARPLDQGKQGNADGDAKGDACDPCPSDPNDGCKAPDPDDLDGDGWANGADNCPDDPNPGQEDADQDGKGDACDTCATANPAFAACPISIEALRDPAHPQHPKPGAAVKLTGLYVTALRPDTGKARGFYVQDASLKPFTGIFVFTAGVTPGVAVGNKVDISATYEEFFNLSELVNAAVTITDSGTTLPFGPIAITNPAEIATGGAKAEGYESMLVSISAVQVTNMNPDSPKDFDELAVTGNLRVDDELDPTIDNTFLVGASFSKITGILTFSFSNHKLAPRSASEMVP
ncbi:MAG: amidohydrolase family protein [Myxococcales bacterium]|nr:amidohydrolase family protein [Myxococcales bacterium]